MNRRDGTFVILAIVLAAVIVFAAVGDSLALAAIHGYQRALSPVAARVGIRCRFTPTCSRYAEAVIERDGLVRGGWKALTRIGRCGPWTPMGTIDPP